MGTRGGACRSHSARAAWTLRPVQRRGARGLVARPNKRTVAGTPQRRAWLACSKPRSPRRRTRAPRVLRRAAERNVRPRRPAASAALRASSAVRTPRLRDENASSQLKIGALLVPWRTLKCQQLALECGFAAMGDTGLEPMTSASGSGWGPLVATDPHPATGDRLLGQQEVMCDVANARAGARCRDGGPEGPFKSYPGIRVGLVARRGKA